MLCQLSGYQEWLAATIGPGILDSAAWRWFSKVVSWSPSLRKLRWTLAFAALIQKTRATSPGKTSSGPWERRVPTRSFRALELGPVGLPWVLRLDGDAFFVKEMITFEEFKVG